MPIVSDWQKPLLESLTDMMNSKNTSIKDLDELTKAAAALDTSDPDVSVLLVKLDNRRRILDKEYEDAAAAIDSNDTAALQKAVDKLVSFGDYREAKEKVQAGRDRILKIQKEKQLALDRQIAEQKKRRRIIIIAVAACIAAVAAFFVVKDQLRKRDIAAILAQGQTLIQDGREREITEPLAKLQDLNADRDQIRTLSGDALIHLAEREGFAAAFALRDSLSSSMSGAVNWSDFSAYAKNRLEEGLPVQEGWLVALDALQNGNLKMDDALMRQTHNNYISMLTEQAEGGQAPSAETWEELSPYLTSVKTDPALAMRLVYALNGAGQDMDALFPNGILVDIPVGASVSALNRTFTSSFTSPALPDMTAAIPVLIKEATTDDRDQEIYTRIFSTEDKLKEGIEDIQAADSHYSVYLLPKYLVSMDEALRAKTYEECTCLVAMQQSYLLSFLTYTETEHKSTGAVAYIRPTYTTTSNYRGSFCALDLEAIYDLKERDHFSRISTVVHDSVIEGDGWYQQHKNDLKSELYTAENCLGVHDTQALTESFADTMEYLAFYEIMIQTPDETQEDADPAAEEPAAEAAVPAANDYAAAIQELLVPVPELNP